MKPSVIKPNHPWLRRRPALLALCLALGSLPSVAQAWWNEDFAFRKPLTVTPAAAGVTMDGELTDLPVLLRLHDGNFNFANAAADGSDLRVVADDDLTPLKFHIEKWDSVFNMAQVWVRLPQVKAGAPTTLWLYHGNARAVAEAQPRDSYADAYRLVYHFAEQGSPVQDASASANHSPSTVASNDGGLIGNAARLDGQTAVDLPAASSLAVAAGSELTLSLWVKPAIAAQDGVLYARRDGAAALLLGLAQGVPYLELTDASGATQRVAGAAPLPETSWHHVAVVARTTGLSLYVGGVAVAELPIPLPAFASAARLGADLNPADPAALPSAFVGDIDELNIATVARSAVWLALAANNQSSADALIAYGGDEASGGGAHDGYMGAIIDSVTIDGWVVIGILAVMAVISWYVMASKAQQIGRVSRGNAAFQGLYQQLGVDARTIAQLDNLMVSREDLPAKDRKLAQDSPLFHLLKRGLHELRSRTHDPRTGAQRRTLSAQSIEAIRAELDAGIVQETQSLNKLMVLLTIAISGGPFLGLLGTVVGVMITFGAIAASGDVNINAIAPGIAAALVATVAGLAVAIPALFGYNYLVTRINDATASMQVFMDAFVARMAEAYDDASREAAGG